MLNKLIVVLLLLTGCRSLGVAKVEFLGTDEEYQACLFNPKQTAAHCVDMTAYLVEYSMALELAKDGGVE